MSLVAVNLLKGPPVKNTIWFLYVILKSLVLRKLFLDNQIGFNTTYLAPRFVHYSTNKLKNHDLV